jgi:hypothetical protein
MGSHGQHRIVGARDTKARLRTGRALRHGHGHDHTGREHAVRRAGQRKRTHRITFTVPATGGQNGCGKVASRDATAQDHRLRHTSTTSSDRFGTRRPAPDASRVSRQSVIAWRVLPAVRRNTMTPC